MRASRIHKNLEVANRMEPYASRLRLRLKHFDVSDPKKKQRLANAHREMTKILVKKKVHPDEARRAVTRTLDIAADHLLEVLRRDQNLQGLSRSQRDLRRLIKQLDHLRLAISTLPPLAKSKLNKIVAEQDWQNFDTETLIRLIHAMADTLANSSPACIANEALRAINEPVRGSKHPAVAQIVRTAPPANSRTVGNHSSWNADPSGSRLAKLGAADETACDGVSDSPFDPAGEISAKAKKGTKVSDRAPPWRADFQDLAWTRPTCWSRFQRP
jgi:hypothetical protein